MSEHSRILVSFLKMKLFTSIVPNRYILSMEYKDSKLKITPGNSKSYLIKAIENGMSMSEAYNKQEFMERLLEDRYCTQPNAKCICNGTTYRIGECRVRGDRYSWFFGYGYVFDDIELTAVWYGIRKQ